MSSEYVLDAESVSMILEGLLFRANNILECVSAVNEFY